MNDFLGNGYCEDELNNGDCMFDGLDCCGYDNDGDYDDDWDISPGVAGGEFVKNNNVKRQQKYAN